MMSAAEPQKPQVKQEGDRGTPTQSSEKSIDGSSQNRQAPVTSASSNVASNLKDAKVIFKIYFIEGLHFMDKVNKEH